MLREHQTSDQCAFCGGLQIVKQSCIDAGMNQRIEGKGADNS
jgi:hypothetical protein